MKRALITGQNGQDGYYMTELLKSKGYEVIAVPRSFLDKDNLKRFVNAYPPDEIYNFAGVSNVFDPYKDQEQTLAINGWVPQLILHAISEVNPKIKFFQASSSLVFGNYNPHNKMHEESLRDPQYPYGAAKNYADTMVKVYREDKGIFAVSGIFFNHISPRQNDLFFAKKVCNAAKNKELIMLGSLDAFRDFGYAPDYMEAAWMMLQAETPDDYIIGTGVMTKLEEFVNIAYVKAGLDYKDYVRTDDTLFRNNDDLYLCANANQIQADLGWKPTHNVEQIIEKMMAV